MLQRLYTFIKARFGRRSACWCCCVAGCVYLLVPVLEVALVDGTSAREVIVHLVDHVSPA